MDKLTKNVVYAAIIGAATLSSCSKDKDLYDDSQVEKEYSANFVSKFGNIAADQDWDAATRGSVNVTTQTSSEVKIYALVDSVYRLVGDYEGVSGKQTLEFDLPKGVEDIMVNTAAGSFKTKLGGSVAFTETRAAYTGTTNGVKVSDYSETDGSEGVELTKSDCKVIFEKLPEGVNNLGKVTQNFYLTSDKDIVIYPIYWKTSETLTVGVYYTDAAGNKVETEVYTMKDTDTSNAKLLVKQDVDGVKKTGSVSYTNKQNNSSFLELLNVISQEHWKNGTISDEEQKALAEKMVELKFFNDGYTFSNFQITDKTNWKSNKKTVYGGTLQYDYTTPSVHDTEWKIFCDSKNPDYAFIDDLVGDGKILSKGIRISLPQDKKYGMYIKRASDGVKFYSEQNLNHDGNCHAAIYKKNKKTYLGFEDWNGSGNDCDLNDFVFMMKSVERESTNDESGDVEIHDKDVEENPYTWILACEDLGSTDDYDFNDIVLGINYVSGQRTVKITPLAAGGTIKAVVKFDGKTLREIHEWLGESANADGSYPMINTYGITNSGETIEVTLDDDVTDYTISNIDSKGKDKLGLIKITVGDETTTNARTIVAPTTGEVPQMLVVKGTWQWPIERNSIESAYTDFPNWVGDASYNWEPSKVASKVVSR